MVPAAEVFPAAEEPAGEEAGSSLGWQPASRIAAQTRHSHFFIGFIGEFLSFPWKAYSFSSPSPFPGEKRHNTYAV